MLMGVRTWKCLVYDQISDGEKEGLLISFGFERGFKFKLCIVYGLLLMVLFICTYSFFVICAFSSH